MSAPPTTPAPVGSDPVPPPRKNAIGRGLMIGAAVVAAIGTAIGGYAALSEDDGPKANGNTSTIYGDGCIAFADGVCLHLDQVLRDPSIADEEFRAGLAASSQSQKEPPAEGPYQFVVIGTADLGLKVRSGPLAKDRQIGTAANRTVVWAECQQKTNFDPDPTLGAGPVWVKIHWPNATPSREFFNSEPGVPAQGWIHRGYIVPAGHNGDIRSC